MIEGAWIIVVAVVAFAAIIGVVLLVSGKRKLDLDPATKRAVARTGRRPLCSCLEAQYDTNKRWHELKFHWEEQDTSCDAWKRLLEIIDQCAIDGAKVFEPGGRI